MDYTILASDEILSAVSAALRERNVEPLIVRNKEEALEHIKKLIPAGASVMNGASRTLEEIGYIEHLKSGAHGWRNFHDGILAEKDPAAQMALRRQALSADYYLGSVHALAQTGEMVIASNSGSQLPHVAYSSPNLILVVGAQKITPTLDDARRRLREHVIPLEDARMKQAYGPESGTKLNKEFIFHGENTAFSRRTIRVLLVKETLGF